jgi:hypothetical protein
MVLHRNYTLPLLVSLLPRHANSDSHRNKKMLTSEVVIESNA